MPCITKKACVLDMKVGQHEDDKSIFQKQDTWGKGEGQVSRKIKCYCQLWACEGRKQATNLSREIIENKNKKTCTTYGFSHRLGAVLSLPRGRYGMDPLQDQATVLRVPSTLEGKNEKKKQEQEPPPRSCPLSQAPGLLPRTPLCRRSLAFHFRHTNRKKSS